MEPTSFRHVVVAIDGPAASGKSTVARTLARRLGFAYVNTGAMYRAVTWYALENGGGAIDEDDVLRRLGAAKLECKIVNSESRFSIDGFDPTPHLLSEPVNQNVSRISAIAEVRKQLVALQRATACDRNVVMEGRDIGSAVFPETPYKFYIDASAEVRAQRREKQGLQDSIGQRDQMDSTRRTSPLVIAEDSHVIDSSHLTIDGVVGEIVGRLKLKGLAVQDVTFQRAD